MKYTFVILLSAAFILDSALLMKLSDSDSSDVENTSSTMNSDLNSEASTEKPTESEQEESKGFQLPNNTGSIVPISNSTLPSGIAGFLDELAAAAGSFASGVSQVVETATGIVQNATNNTNITNPFIPSADKAPASKAVSMTDKPLVVTSVETDSSSPSPIPPNEDVSTNKDEDAKDRKSTMPPQPTESTSNEDGKTTSKENSTVDAATQAATEAQEQGQGTS